MIIIQDNNINQLEKAIKAAKRIFPTLVKSNNVGVKCSPIGCASRSN